MGFIQLPQVLSITVFLFLHTHHDAEPGGQLDIVCHVQFAQSASLCGEFAVFRQHCMWRGCCRGDQRVQFVSKNVVFGSLAAHETTH